MTVVGQLTLPDSHAPQLVPFAERVMALLATRIDPVTVIVKPRADMPLYAPGKNARGFWRERRRTIALADDLFKVNEPLDETFGHEVIHVLFSDWLTKSHRAQLLPLMTPMPESFGDMNINGQHVGYRASPEECCCVWGSAAIFGFDPPAYVGLYKRSIPKAKLPALREILLADAATPPPDPCQPLKDRLTEVAAGLDGLLPSLASASNRLRTEATDLDGLNASLAAIANKARA